jgi:uncharacterized RDD family membrane protein YckC
MEESKIIDEKIFQDFAFQRIAYGGFWRRLGANLIDMIVLIPIGLLSFYFIIQANIWVAIFIQLIGGIIGAIYTTTLHALYGATLGKMATGLQVRKLNFTPIGWMEAVKRNSVDYGFTILSLIGNISVLLIMPMEELHQSSVLELGKLIQSYQSPVYSLIQSMFTLWFWGEVIVLLFNKKKRAIHDYIAGTVVVVEDSLNEILEKVAA